MRKPFAIVLGIGLKVESADLHAVTDKLKSLDYLIRRTTTLGPYAVDIAREHHRGWMDGADLIVTVGGFDAAYPQLIGGLGLAWDRLIADPHADRPILVGMQHMQIEASEGLLMTEPPRIGVSLATADALVVLETIVSGESPFS